LSDSFLLDNRIAFVYDYLIWKYPLLKGKNMGSIRSIKWTEESINHIAYHAISPLEVEELCFNEEDLPFIRSGRENLHYVFGKTYAGRLLFVVVRFVRRGEVKIVTARDMNTWERKYYKTRGK
jgi:hypothetical protein